MSQRRSSESIQADLRILEEFKKAQELRKRAQEARQEFQIQAVKVLDMVTEERAAHDARVAERAKDGGKERAIPEKEVRRRSNLI